jgi:putative nucleotidyltransferase with HDIG domain
MEKQSQRIKGKTFLNKKTLQILLLIFTSLLTLVALLFPSLTGTSSYLLDIGDVAPQDILAPASLNYTSEFLTNQAKIDAEASVQDIYLPMDPNISRQMLENLRISLNYINIVRLDNYASLEQKLLDLTSLNLMLLDNTTEEKLLALTETQWQAIQKECLTLLEETMRDTIRSDEIDNVISRIPSRISFAFPLEQANIITTLITPFISPNSIFSSEQTQAAREKARDSIQPITRQYIVGETIVRRGQVLTAKDVEALQQFKLIGGQDNLLRMTEAVILTLLIGSFEALYFSRRKLLPFQGFRSLIMTALWFVVLLFLARGFSYNRTILPYLFPIPAFGLAMASLFSFEIGIISSVIIALATTFGMPNGLELFIFYMIASFCGLLVLGKGRRITSFFQAGIIIGLVGTAVILSHRLTDITTNWIGLAELVGSVFINGIASASLALLIQFVFSQLLGITTALQLHDLARSDHPLLQLILHNAPGTYQHSLQVANLAEQAAEEIGADSLLCRVGALYHDVGKTNNPLFYIENQVPGQIDTHDDVDPYLVSETIIQHIPEGYNLAKKYRLPNRIRDFINEHHGTMMTRYQYTKALQQAENSPQAVEVARFQYPGPAPRSKETALLMLADGCEARARADLPKNEDELRAIVKKVIDSVIQLGQLDNTNLTLRDLNLVGESFVKSLQNTYHPRIKYPELKSIPKKNNGGKGSPQG